MAHTHTQDLPTIKVKNLRELKHSSSIYLAWSGKDSKGFAVFYVQKFTPEGTAETYYTIRSTNSGKDTVCNCPAHIDNCRHKRLLSYMIRHGGLNNPQRPIVTDGKQMAWLDYSGQLISEDYIELIKESLQEQTKEDK